MKNLTSALVLALTLTGSAAFTQIQQDSPVVSATKTQRMPMPLCPPDDPNACGLGSNH